MIKRIIKILLKYPIILFNKIYTYYYYKNSSKNDNIDVDDMFKRGKNVLVFSPHVDDETIGLGGALLKHKDNSDEVSVVYITDGRGSTSEFSEDKTIELRRKEGEELKKVLNIKEMYFLDEEDGQVDSNKVELINEICEILNSVKPDIIYTPFLIDGHRDHVETTKLLINALSKEGGNFENIYMYEVNCPIMPEIINSMNIMEDDIFKKKEKLFSIFKSQWAMGFDAFILLNRRKKLILDKGDAAEVFVKGNHEEVKKIKEFLETEEFDCNNFRQLSSEYNLFLSFRKGKAYKKKYSHVVNEFIERKAVSQ